MICLICKKHFKDITNTHLKLHGLTRSSYRKIDKDFDIYLSKRMREISKGKIDIKKGKKYEDVVGEKKAEEWKRKIGLKAKGKTHVMSEESKRKQSEKRKGKRNSPATEFKKGRLEPRGELSRNWKGGLTSLVGNIRNSFKYRQWRSDVFTRDNFTCQECGQRGGKLHAHHIKSFSSILQYYEITNIEEALNCEELWNINNGITYCEECHKKTDSYLKKLIK